MAEEPAGGQAEAAEGWRGDAARAREAFRRGDPPPRPEGPVSLYAPPGWSGGQHRLP